MIPLFLAVQGQSSKATKRLPREVISNLMAAAINSTVRTSQPRRISRPVEPQRLAMASSAKFDKMIRPISGKATHKTKQFHDVPIPSMVRMVAVRIITVNASGAQPIALKPDMVWVGYWS